MPDLAVIPAERLGADVVEKLEEVLARARAGGISSVAIAVVYRDGSTGDAWSNAPSIATLIGAATVLQRRLIGIIE